MGAAHGIVPWPGGKGWLVPRLLPLIPPHVCYAEVFGGAAALLFNKPPSKAEVYNDIDSGLVTLFRVAKYHPQALIEELQLIAMGREEFEARLDHPGLTDVQRAASFYWRRCMGFGGKAGRGSFGVCVAHSGGARRSKAAIMAFVYDVAARLDRVVVEHRDWRRILAQYDRPTTFFFLDPPYEAGRENYVQGFAAADVADLAERLAGLQGSWLVTLNDAPHVRDAFAGCEIIPVERISRRNNTASGGDGRRILELIIRPAASRP